MPPKLTKAPTSEYEYSYSDLVELISKDLKVSSEDITVRFDIKEDPLDDSLFARKIVTAKVTVTHPNMVQSGKIPDVIHRIMTNQNLPKKVTFDRPTISEWVYNYVRTKFHYEGEIHNELSFVNDIGVDSLDFYEIVMDAEREFNTTITDESMEKLKNVGDAIEVIEFSIQAESE